MHRPRHLATLTLTALVAFLTVAAPVQADQADNLRSQLAYYGYYFNTSTYTPPIFEVPDGLVQSADLALGKPTTAASYYNATYHHSKAADGNPATRWRSTSNYAYWRVDLGTVQPINQVAIDWQSPAGTYAIRTSIDGAALAEAATETGVQAGVRTSTFAPRAARYVHLYPAAGSAPAGYVSIWSVEVRNTGQLPPGQKVTQCGYLTGQCDAAAGRPFAALQDRWLDVPVPDYFAASLGTDLEAVILDNQNGKTYEFWKMREDYSVFPGWSARWGGGADDSEFTQAYGVRAWPTPGGVKLGTQASGIAFTPGVIRWRDLVAGVADHPMQIVLPKACTTFVYPATRQDGVGGADCVPYGTRFGLPASVDVDAIRSTTRWCGPGRVYNGAWIGRTLQEALAAGWDSTALTCPMTPLAEVIAKSIQQHGAIATDQNNSDVSFRLENWQRPHPPWAPASDVAVNPYGPYFGCDGVDNSGFANPTPVGTAAENDCAGYAALNYFPWVSLVEVP